MSTQSAILTQSQSARLQRMLEVAAQLALEGGWDAVQMREVAQRSEVALGTLYRYFPSKEYLLVSVMISDIEGLVDRLAVRPAEGTDPIQRVINVLGRSNRALQRQPQITIAMIRALVSGNQEIPPAVKQTRVLMRRIISDALGADGMAIDIDPEQVLMRIDLLSDVWLAALGSWISGVEPDSSVMLKLELASKLLL
ncbi:MAG: TetR family transcriptional regulator, partial [Microthrixaceae bacterium]